MTPNGETIEAASAGRSGVIYSVLPSEPRDGLLSAIAQGSMHASRIPVARMQIAQAESPALALSLAACREGLLLQLRQNLVCGGLHSVEHRLARWLLEAADRLEMKVIPATQEHVAQRLGVRRTTVTLLASKLEDAGAIHWGRSRIDVVDRGRLESMACSCYGDLRDRWSRLVSPDAPASARGLIG
jgi:hypothetical protein